MLGERVAELHRRQAADGEAGPRIRQAAGRLERACEGLVSPQGRAAEPALRPGPDAGQAGQLGPVRGGLRLDRAEQLVAVVYRHLQGSRIASVHGNESAGSLISEHVHVVRELAEVDRRAGQERQQPLIGRPRELGTGGRAGLVLHAADDPGSPEREEERARDPDGSKRHAAATRRPGERVHADVGRPPSGRW